jgi:hypothetical protein
VRAELEQSFELEVHDSVWPPARDELLPQVAGKDGLMLMLTDRVDDELLDAAGPQLRIVADYAVGIDNVDLEACRRRGIVVSNTPDVLTETTAELTIAIVLALLRRVAEGDRLIRRGEEWIWAPNLMLGRGLPGLRLGLVGHGRIGSAVERLARAHGMEVTYSTRSGGVPLDELLAASDVVSLHLPLTDDSRHLIDEAALARMKPTAVLVNVSRGADRRRGGAGRGAAGRAHRGRGAGRLRARARGAPRPRRARERRAGAAPRLGHRGNPGGDGDAVRRGSAGGAARGPGASQCRWVIHRSADRRTPIAPRAGLLQLRRDAEQGRLVRGPADQLHADGQTVAVPVERH